MRILIFVPLMFFPSFVLADWLGPYSIWQGYKNPPNDADECIAQAGTGGGNHHAVYFLPDRNGSTDSNGNPYSMCQYMSLGINAPVESPPETLSEGQSLVATYIKSNDSGFCPSPEYDFVDQGGYYTCIPPVPTDEYCQGLDPVELRVPAEYPLDTILTSGGCSWQASSEPGIDVSFPNGDFSVLMEPIGAAPEAPDTAEDLEPPPEDLDTGWGDPEEGLTPTSDPATDCPYSYVSGGDQDYCYSGPDANQPSEYPDDSVRVDHYDGSYTIIEPDGTTTEYTADGSIKTPSSAPDTAGGEDYGEGESGIIKAISGLKNSVENGFDKLVDKFTGKADEVVDELTEEAPEGDSLIADSNLDELSDQVDQEAEAHTDNVTEKLDEIGEDDSSAIADQVTGNFPDLPSSSCTPLTFGQAPFEFTISCEIFDRIRTWFGWIIYFWTAVSIMDTFFAPATRRA